MQGALDSDLLNKEAGFRPASDFHFEHHDPDALNAGLHYLLLLCCEFRARAKLEEMQFLYIQSSVGLSKSSLNRTPTRTWVIGQGLRRQQILSEQNLSSPDWRTSQPVP